jgi:hypothetical protein
MNPIVAMKKMNGWAWGLALALTVFFLSGQGIPLHQAALAHPVQTAIVFLLAAVLVAGRLRDRLGQGLDWMFHLPRARFNLGVFFIAVLAYAGIAWFLFGGIPRIDDGMASLFQARLFARGVFTLPLPADAGFLDIFGVLGARQNVGHWCGIYPPGWPLLLTPGVWLGVPWLVNPVLGALLLVAIAELGRDLYGDRVGRAAALLALPSPFLLVLSGLHLSHMATALFLCLALLGLRKLWASSRWIWGGAAGLSWGMAFLCRPLDAVVLGALFALGFLAPPERLWRCRLGIAAGLATALLAAGVLLGFQEITTGDWRTPGHEIGMGSRGQFGFVQLTPYRAHTPARGLEHTFLRLRALNDNLLGWAVPSLLIVMLPFLLRRARLRDFLLLLPLPALLLTFACFWYYEVCFPARYISAALPYLFILAARGLFTLQETVGSRGLRSQVPAFLVVSGAWFLAVSTPFHFQMYDQSYYDVEEVLPRVVRDYGITHAIVFMDAVGLERHDDDDDNDYYATGFMRNDLDLNGDVLYVRNLRERNIELVRRHPDRAGYLYRYHRGEEKAYLYRLALEGDELKMAPVKPTTPDLLAIPE